MDVHFVAQPYADQSTLREFLLSAASDRALQNLDVAVAWITKSGLLLVRDALEGIRARGGRTRLIVGIDLGGTTWQGLKFAAELFDTVHVFHEEGVTTFHPKIYFASGPNSARLMVGSQNFTGKGLISNYEAALECTLDNLNDFAFVNSVHGYFNRLYDDVLVCRQLNQHLLQGLRDDPARYQISDEDHPPVYSGGDVDPNGSDDRSKEGQRAPLFGPSRAPKKFQGHWQTDSAGRAGLALNSRLINDFRCPPCVGRRNHPGQSWKRSEWDPDKDGGKAESLLQGLNEKELDVLAHLLVLGTVGLTNKGIRLLADCDSAHISTFLSSLAGKFTSEDKRPIWGWDPRCKCFWIPDGPVRALFLQTMARCFPEFADWVPEG